MAVVVSPFRALGSNEAVECGVFLFFSFEDKYLLFLLERRIKRSESGGRGENQ